MDVGRRQYTLRFEGRYDPMQFKELILEWREGRPIRLGDIDYLMSDLEWVYGLLTNFKMPGDMLTNFLETYAGAIESAMGPSAGPLVEWLHEGAREVADFNGAAERK